MIVGLICKRLNELILWAIKNLAKNLNASHSVKANWLKARFHRTLVAKSLRQQSIYGPIKTQKINLLIFDSAMGVSRYAEHRNV